MLELVALINNEVFRVVEANQKLLRSFVAQEIPVAVLLDLFKLKRKLLIEKVDEESDEVFVGVKQV